MLTPPPKTPIIFILIERETTEKETNSSTSDRATDREQGKRQNFRPPPTAQKIEPIYRPFRETIPRMNSKSIRREGGLIRDYINFAGHLQGTLNKNTSYIFPH